MSTRYDPTQHDPGGRGGRSDAPHRIKPKNRDRNAIKHALHLVSKYKRGDISEAAFVKGLGPAVDVLGHKINKSENRGTYTAKDAAIAARLQHRLKNVSVSDPHAQAMVSSSLKSVRHINKETDTSGGGSNNGGGGHHGGRNHGGGNKHHGGKGGHKGGKGGKKGDNKFVPGVYEEDPGLRNEARTLVMGGINDELRTYLRGIKQLRRSGHQDVAQARTIGKRTRGDLRAIFGEVGDYTKDLNQKIQGNFRDLRKTGDAEFDALMSGLSDTSGVNRDAALAEQDRLGIGAAGLGTFNADAAAAASRGRSDRSDFNASNLAQAQAASAVGGLLAGGIKGEQASSIGKAINATNDSITGIRDLYKGGIADLRQQAMDTRLGAGNDINQLMLQLEDRDYNRWAEQNQQTFLNQMATNQFRLSKNQFNSENQWRFAQLQQQQAAERTKTTASNLSRQAGGIMDSILGIFR